MFQDSVALSVAGRNPGRMAVFIDGENVPPSAMEQIDREIGRPAALSVRRAYGDPAKLQPWSSAGYRLVYSGTGKNSADMHMCVDAIELACEGKIETFIIASSDRDFTYLVHRLREREKTVIVFGEAKSPETLRNSATEFRLISTVHVGTTTPDTPISPVTPATKIIPMVRKALLSNQRTDGYCTKRWLEQQLGQNPDFVAARFGKPDLASLLKAVKQFEFAQDLNGETIIRFCPPKSPAS